MTLKTKNLFLAITRIQIQRRLGWGSKIGEVREGGWGGVEGGGDGVVR